LQTRWLAIAAVLVAAYGAGLLYEMVAAPAVCCGLTWPSPDPVQADRILARTDPQGRDAAAQRRAATLVLRARPGDPSAWLRLAYADRLANGRLSDAGRHDVDTSYLLAPYGGAWTPWRISFALDNWTNLGASSQAAAIKEINIVVTQDSELIRASKIAVSTVHDPSGRLVAALLGLGQIKAP
jgi:hypothetical protein